MKRGEPPEKTQEIVGELLNESDRGLALICAEQISEELESLLRSKLAAKKATADLGKIVDPMFKSSTGPLHSFSARIKFAYVFGWIPTDIFKDLENIRSIRNEFAHSSGKLRFTSPSIQARVKLLNIGYEFETLFMFLQSRHSKIVRLPEGLISAERAAFIGATMLIRGELMGLAGKFGEKYKPFPRLNIMPKWDQLQAKLESKK